MGQEPRNRTAAARRSPPALHSTQPLGNERSLEEEALGSREEGKVRQ